MLTHLLHVFIDVYSFTDYQAQHIKKIMKNELTVGSGRFACFVVLSGDENGVPSWTAFAESVIQSRRHHLRVFRTYDVNWGNVITLFLRLLLLSSIILRSRQE